MCVSTTINACVSSSLSSWLIKIDADLHREVLERYRQLDIAPYKGFLNPRMIAVTDDQGEITDIRLDYSESYEEQMLRYSKEYATL